MDMDKCFLNNNIVTQQTGKKKIQLHKISILVKAFHKFSSIALRNIYAVLMNVL